MLLFNERVIFNRVLCKQLIRLNHYKVLNVPVTASKQEIRKKYIELSKMHHPDVTGNTNEKEVNELFVKYNEAYRILRDDNLRREYDIKMGLNQQSSSSTDYTTYNEFYNSNVFRNRADKLRFESNEDAVNKENEARNKWKPTSFRIQREMAMKQSEMERLKIERETIRRELLIIGLIFSMAALLNSFLQ